MHECHSLGLDTNDRARPVTDRGDDYRRRQGAVSDAAKGRKSEPEPRPSHEGTLAQPVASLPEKGVGWTREQADARPGDGAGLESDTSPGRRHRLGGQGAKGFGAHTRASPSGSRSIYSSRRGPRGARAGERTAGLRLAVCVMGSRALKGQAGEARPHGRRRLHRRDGARRGWTPAGRS